MNIDSADVSLTFPILLCMFCFFMYKNIYGDEILVVEFFILPYFKLNFINIFLTKFFLTNWIFFMDVL